jgi:hypothetical protein
MRLILGIAAVALTVQVGEQVCPIAKEKWKCDYPEKTWGIKIKAIKCTKNQLPETVSVILEFTKDLKGDELKTCKEVFERKNLNDMKKGPEFCFFDQDGVIFTKAMGQNYIIHGDVSGIKGDAIRCDIKAEGALKCLADEKLAQKVSKVDLRPSSQK